MKTDRPSAQTAGASLLILPQEDGGESDGGETREVVVVVGGLPSGKDERIGRSGTEEREKERE